MRGPITTHRCASGCVLSPQCCDATGSGQWRLPTTTRSSTKQYHDALKGMVENQLRASITAVSSYWFTAWVNAGRPDLSTLDAESLTKQNAKNYKKELKIWRKEGKLMNLKPANEF